jgi:hypothetical protein
MSRIEGPMTKPLPELGALVRTLLERACEDGLLAPDLHWDDPSPQARTDEELAGVIETLRRFLEELMDSPPEGTGRVR